MKSLLLSGYGISLNVDSGKLIIKNGLDRDRKEHEEYIYKPKFIDIDNIIIYGHTGNITINAIKWLMKFNVPVNVLNYDGKLLTTMNPPQSMNSFIKMGQYRAYNNGIRIDIAKSFINAKIQRTKMVMDWLLERYPEITKYYKLCKFDKTLSDLAKENKIRNIMGIEGITARYYFEGLSKLFPDKFEFESRSYGKTQRPLGAVDPINALFNYGYSILESHCLKAINSNNLDPNIGFLHEMLPSKTPLAYDLQEPFRWLVDITLINALEKKLFVKKDFIRTEDLITRVQPSGIKKLMDELDFQFSKRVRYRNKNWQWSSIIDIKAHELANYLLGKSKTIEFYSPKYTLERQDNNEMRELILNMPYKKWKDMGFSKGSLHYLKQNAKSDEPFKIYGKVMEKLENINI